MTTAITQADLIAQMVGLVESVPGVAGLHGGAFGEIATYLPGGQIAGIRISSGRVQVHLIVTPDHPVHATAEAVRRAITALVDQPVDVTVEDLAVPDEPLNRQQPGHLLENS